MELVVRNAVSNPQVIALLGAKEELERKILINEVCFGV